MSIRQLVRSPPEQGQRVQLPDHFAFFASILAHSAQSWRPTSAGTIFKVVGIDVLNVFASHRGVIHGVFFPGLRVVPRAWRPPFWSGPPTSRDGTTVRGSPQVSDGLSVTVTETMAP